MHKLLLVLVLLATALAPGRGSTADFGSTLAFHPRNIVVPAGGMGGGTGAGMGGMGGMGGAGMGGMTGGGIGGMGAGMGGRGGGTTGYGFAPGAGLGQTGSATDPGGGGAQPSQYYLCVTRYDRCSLAASPGSLRRGSACTCSTGHTGKIK